MRKCLAAVVAVVVLPALNAARAAVTVEQIEAYEDTTSPKSHYAPVDFGGNSTLAGTGSFSGVTFHALNATTNTLSSHANTVGGLIYGSGAAGNPYVTNVYAAAADDFFDNTVLPQTAVSATGPVPNHFAGGAQVINNSYVASDTSNVDDQRRIDFMINRDDVTFVAAAADTGLFTGNYLDWSSFNSLAVRGDQDGFDPTGSPGKSHVDLGLLGHASFAAATVSGYAAGLYGHAQTAGQTAAQHGVVVRSLLMAGADKTIYTRQTANNLDTQWGAGEPDFNTSLAILGGGQQTLSAVSASTVAATATLASQGWSFGTVNSGSTSAVVVHISSLTTSVTASLNWNVTSNQPSGSTIDTTNAGLIFPDLSLELRPLIASGAGQFTLGASSSDTTLHSNATGDNVEYLYSTSALAPGDYAFLIGGDATRSTSIGFSYSVIGPPTTQWNLSTGGSWGVAGNWTGVLPNAPTVRESLSSAPGLTAPATVTLDGNRTVGQLTFNNSNSYTVSPGTGGTLTIDDTGDNNPLIAVTAGSHAITANIAMVNGLNVNLTTGTALNLAGNLTGGGNVTVAGGGTLIIGGSLPATAALTANSPTNFTGNTTSTTQTRTLAGLNVGIGVTVAVLSSTFPLTPVTLHPSSLTLTNSMSKIDLANNILIAPGTASSAMSLITNNQIISGLANGELGYITLDATNFEIRWTLPGDTNLDGAVNVSDLGNLATNFGSTRGTWIQGDFDRNGSVNVADLGDLATNFGQSLAAGTAAPTASAAATSTVPEPAALSLIALTASTALMRRRRRKH